MDGTLTEAHIDFADMRARTGIPQGDLFTVMESWDNPAAIKAAMDVILEIEAGAAARVRLKEGAVELLSTLKDKGCRVALVTRNTPASVQAFFDLVGPEWAALFDPVLTREFPYVKPDKRLLEHVAQAWGLEPWRLLMVGDSAEDVEVGNAAGTASCLVAGGGNEKPGAAPAAPLPGAAPTLTVSGLPDLRARLLAAENAPAATDMTVMPCPESAGPAGAVALGWPAREAVGLPVQRAGAPPPGLAFLDWLVEVGGLKPSAASFPRMGAAAGGLATCPPEQYGDRVLHIGCGAGGLTKMMASQGMQVTGADMDVMAATRRGLVAVPLGGRTAMGRPAGSSLRGALAQNGAWDGEAFDAIVLHKDGGHADAAPDAGAPSTWLAPGALTELGGVLSPYGRLCAEVALTPATRINPAAIINAINASRLTVVAWQVVKAGGGAPQRMRLVARPT